MMNRFFSCLFVLLLPLAVASAQTAPQAAPVGDVLLTINGEIERPLKLRAADLAKLPRRTVEAKDHDGRATTFEGFLLFEVLRLGGVTFGEKLRGPLLATYLLVEAADEYRVVYALPELDPAFTDRTIILADRRDGKPLSADEGPLRVVVPDEKRPARWVRQVTTLTILRVVPDKTEKAKQQ